MSVAIDAAVESPSKTAFDAQYDDAATGVVDSDDGSVVGLCNNDSSVCDTATTTTSC